MSTLVYLTLLKILEMLHDTILVAVDILISAFCAWYTNHDFIKSFQDIFCKFSCAQKKDKILKSLQITSQNSFLSVSCHTNTIFKEM